MTRVRTGIHAICLTTPNHTVYQRAYTLAMVIARKTNVCMRTLRLTPLLLFAAPSLSMDTATRAQTVQNDTYGSVQNST
ncbi:hypothetical protein Q9L58_000650 [Maublancomyces gigas]|uniref:Uncharacterized protein n=1 Tax=Discina gigas TaxID=1032678 RepID=A0ABR3GWX6_9PEZI